MSVLHSIAYDLVNLDGMAGDQRKLVSGEARKEAHELGYWISGCRSSFCCASPPNSSHKLTRWNKNTFREQRRYKAGQRPGITERSNALFEGTVEGCCRALINHITPSNPEK